MTRDCFLELDWDSHMSMQMILVKESQLAFEKIYINAVSDDRALFTNQFKGNCF